MIVPSVRTFLVECYVTGVDEAAVAEAGARVRRIAGTLAEAGDPISYIGALLVAEDEVVFHAFTARDAALVQRVCREADLSFERIVESIGIQGDAIHVSSGGSGGDGPIGSH